MLFRSRGRDFREVSDPKLTRRQIIAWRAFIELNREREYCSAAHRLIPQFIKEIVIREYYTNVVTDPISYKFFKTLVQALDDTFIEYSHEQASQETV